jgi:hypothetical protein
MLYQNRNLVMGKRGFAHIVWGLCAKTNPAHKLKT